MNKNMTELVFILDRSGSMSGLEDDTIGGFNGMLERQKSSDQQVNVTTVLFDDKVEVIHDRFPVDYIQPLTREDYYVRGCTALLDAIGIAIHKIENVQVHMPEDHRAGKVIFVITTDGHENSSKMYTYSMIHDQIEKKRSEGWEFLFLGANIDAIREAGRLGISEKRAANYSNDQKGVSLNYEVVGKALYRAVNVSVENELFEDDWADEIEEYHSQNHSQNN